MDDDDDFIVPDDAEEDDEDDLPPASPRPASRASSNSSRSSSRLSNYAHTSASELDDDDIEEHVTQKEKSRPKKDRSAPQKAGGTQSGSSNMFLTAAERRALKQKEEKKSTEDPFDFLVDPRDKDGVRPGEPGYDPRTVHIPAKAWKNFTPFEKQVRASCHQVATCGTDYYQMQFWEIKQNHYDTVLFFQKGKFLELYEEDARIGHQEFDLKLTQRVKMSMVCNKCDTYDFNLNDIG